MFICSLHEHIICSVCSGLMTQIMMWMNTKSNKCLFTILSSKQRMTKSNTASRPIPYSDMNPAHPKMYSTQRQKKKVSTHIEGHKVPNSINFYDHQSRLSASAVIVCISETTERKQWPQSHLCVSFLIIIIKPCFCFNSKVFSKEMPVVVCVCETEREADPRERERATLWQKWRRLFFPWGTPHSCFHLYLSWH